VSTSEWQPHTVTGDDVVRHGAVQAVNALFDLDTSEVQLGDPLPALWHWAALPTWARSSTLGVDGHPARGDFLPPVDLPRRMFAGGEVVFHAPLPVGAAIRREDTVTSVVPKRGRTGELVVVGVETRLLDEHGSPLLTEHRDLIYREAARRDSAAATATPESAAALDPVGPPLRRRSDWEWDFATDPTLLMRFSAATANAHRIHYDWPYVTGIEGYPGLVVHGQLMTLALAEVVRRQCPTLRPRRAAHRNMNPLFCGLLAQVRRLEVQATDDAEADVTVSVGVFTADGTGDEKLCATLTLQCDEATGEIDA
jgi:3-methylfumaryl-CoA hydratase